MCKFVLDDYFLFCPQLHKIELRCTGNNNKVLFYLFADIFLFLWLHCLMSEMAEQCWNGTRSVVICRLLNLREQLSALLFRRPVTLMYAKKKRENMVPVQLLIFENVTSSNKAHTPAGPSRPRSAFISPGNLAFSVRQTRLICHVFLWVIVEPSVETLCDLSTLAYLIWALRLRV